MKHGQTKRKRKTKKKNNKSKKTLIIVIVSILLAICLFLGGGFVTWKFFIKQEDNSKAHSQVSTDSVGTNEKIAIRTEAGQDPVYINAIPGMARNPYDDNNFYTNKNGFIEYKHDGKNISTVGIDVSYAQGDIDWAKVKKAGVDFAMIRCGGRGYGTKGILYTDEKFKQNIEGATSAGIKVGVYFYSQAITAKEAKEEADYTLKLIKDYNIQYPVAYDWEHYENEEARTDELDRETLTNCAKAYCSEIEKSGYTPVIYANRSLLYYEYDLAKINNYEVWLASYEDLPDYYYEFGMWQYSTDGTINGIEGTVDLNVCMYKYWLEIIMERITSFSVDHNKLEPGVYISRIDGDITTYDLRFIKPNTPPFLDINAMHTIEHLFATYARNGKLKDNVIYFGPMGCCTGFYLLMRDTSNEDALAYIKEVMKDCMNHQGKIPGTDKIECGNYLAHDAEKAHNSLVEYYNVIKDLTTENLYY